MKNKLYILAIFLFIISSCSQQKSGIKKDNNPEKDKQKFTYLFSEANKNRLLGNPEKAVELYVSAIDINPKSAASNYYLASIFLYEKKYNTALTFAENAVTLNSENIWYNIIKADILSFQNKTAEAINIYNNIQKKQPKNELIYNRIIDILINRINLNKINSTNISVVKNDYLKLINIYSEKQTHFGYDTEISYNLYKLYMDIRDLKNAKETLNAIIKNEPNEPKYQALLAEFYFSQNETKKAEEIYKKIKKNFPNESSVKLSYAIFCKVTGKQKEYLKLTKELLSSDIELNTKINLLISGQYPNFPKQQYEQLINELYKHHSDDLTANTLLAEYYINEDKEKTIPYLKKAVELSNSDINLILTYFEILYDTKNFEYLYNESKKYLEQYPNLPKIFLYNGLSAYKIGKFNEAIFILDSGKDLVIENNKLLVQFHYYLAESFHEKNENSKSDEQFEKTLQINPKFYLALNNYSYYLSERNQNIEKALQMAETCINYQNNNPVFCNTYAKALLKNKKYDKALPFSEKAINTIPDNAEFLETIGDIYFAKNKKEKAKEFWEKSEEKGNTSKTLEYKLKNINKLTIDEL
ncbi:MAG: tetratricopeptide repeat protein [Bacteroidales bacterium]|nr:tetratricopeptide repeat protein [Bacteroidales bacterium]